MAFSLVVFFPAYSPAITLELNSGQIIEGEIISSGSPQQVAQDEKVKQIYLGDQFSF